MIVVSVFGPFNSRVLVEMSAEQAAAVVPDGVLGAAGPSRTVDATVAEVERLRGRDVNLANSSLAASAIAMAYEIDHPYNSATSKANCQARLQDAMRELYALAPPEEKGGKLHDIRADRALRLAGGQEGSPG